MPNAVWNPQDKWTDLELSNYDTTVRKTQTGSYHGIRGLVGYTTGLWYFEGFVPAQGEGSFGVASAAADLNAPLGYGSELGLGLYNDGTLYAGGSAYGSPGGLDNKRVGYLVNPETRRLWIRTSSTVWSHGGDPATGGEGIDFSHISGAIFPMFVGYYTDDTTTLFSNTETIAFGLPAGASFWGDTGGGTVTPTPTRKPIRSVRWF